MSDGKRNPARVAAEGLLSGLILTGAGVGVAAVVSGGKFPDYNTRSAGYFAGTLFITGFVLQVGFEIIGWNKMYCESYMEQVTYKKEAP